MARAAILTSDGYLFLQMPDGTFSDGDLVLNGCEPDAGDVLIPDIAAIPEHTALAEMRERIARMLNAIEDAGE